MNTKSLGIIGSGPMGIGIAQVAIQNKFNVILHDISDDILQHALDKIKNNLNY